MTKVRFDQIIVIASAEAYAGAVGKDGRVSEGA